MADVFNAFFLELCNLVKTKTTYFRSSSFAAQVMDDKYNIHASYGVTQQKCRKQTIILFYMTDIK